LRASAVAFKSFSVCALSAALGVAGVATVAGGAVGTTDGEGVAPAAGAGAVGACAFNKEKKNSDERSVAFTIRLNCAYLIDKSYHELWI
jgi:uncharacterized protein YcfJ